LEYTVAITAMIYKYRKAKEELYRLIGYNVE